MAGTNGRLKLLKRSVSMLLALVMVFGMCVTNTFAADETKKLTNGGITLETSDENFTAAQFSADEKTAEQGFHDFVTQESNVVNNVALMYGNNGFSSEITLKDANGQPVEYSGKLTVSYTLPASWDLSNGVSVVAISTNSMGSYEYCAGSKISSTVEDGKAVFTMDYDSAGSNRLLIMQTAYAADITKLEDGVYDVGLTMLSNVSSMQLSMAANTMNPKAKIIVQDGKIYLNMSFNKGVVMFNPAFANKIYSVDAQAAANGASVGKPDAETTIPGTVLSYYDEDEVMQFSFDTLKNGLQGAMGNTDEQIQEYVSENIMQNGIRYIKNAVLDVTGSIQENGCLLIGFSSDIMDTLYNGVYGSDCGYNTTNVMISNPVKNTSVSAESLLAPSTETDRSKLDDIYADFLSWSGGSNNSLRNIYTADTYNTYYVPAWQQVYQAYTYAYAAQSDVDSALAAAQEAVSKLEYIKVGDTRTNARSLLKGQINKAEAVDGDLYTSASYNALSGLISGAQAVYDLGNDAYNKDVVEQYYLIRDAYNALQLKATDYTALENAISEMEKVDLTGYTEKTTAAFNQAVADAKGLLAAKDCSDAEIADCIQAMYDAKAALSTYDVLEDGIYKLDVEMLKVNRKDPSMAGGAINPTVKLEVADGEYYLTVDFKGMTITNQFGYLSQLWYYGEGYTYDEFGEPQGDLVEAEVLSTQKNVDGSDVIDIYNDKDNLYPDTVKIKLVKTALEDEEGYVPLRVVVPVMEAIAEGNGQHNVLMKLDWSTLEKTTEDDPDIQPEAPVEQSPALDYTDEATRVVIHADRGVFEAGVKAVVNEITSGADYDAAAASVSSVGKKFKLYDVRFTDAAGNEIIPNGTVEISFPVADGYTAENLEIYRIDGEAKTLVRGTLENGFYTVVTKSGGEYCAVEKGSTITDAQNTQNIAANGADGKTPATGDVSGMGIMLIIMLLSAGVLGVNIVSVKRKRVKA